MVQSTDRNGTVAVSLHNLPRHSSQTAATNCRADSNEVPAWERCWRKTESFPAMLVKETLQLDHAELRHLTASS